MLVTPARITSISEPDSAAGCVSVRQIAHTFEGTQSVLPGNSLCIREILLGRLANFNLFSTRIQSCGVCLHRHCLSIEWCGQIRGADQHDVLLAFPLSIFWCTFVCHGVVFNLQMLDTYSGRPLCSGSELVSTRKLSNPSRSMSRLISMTRRAATLTTLAITCISLLYVKTEGITSSARG